MWGLVATSTGLVRRSVPSKVHTAAQAVSGVVVGSFLDVHALAAAGPALLPLLAITAATIVLSPGAGWLLARQTGLDLPTASLGLIAGGSAPSSAWPRTWTPTRAWSRLCSTCDSS